MGSHHPGIVDIFSPMFDKTRGYPPMSNFLGVSVSSMGGNGNHKQYTTGYFYHTHMLHGIFTYMTGWFCSGKCWCAYSGTMEHMRFFFRISYGILRSNIVINWYFWLMGYKPSLFIFLWDIIILPSLYGININGI